MLIAIVLALVAVGSLGGGWLLWVMLQIVRLERREILRRICAPFLEQLFGGLGIRGVRLGIRGLVFLG